MVGGVHPAVYAPVPWWEVYTLLYMPTYTTLGTPSTVHVPLSIIATVVRCAVRSRGAQGGRMTWVRGLGIYLRVLFLSQLVGDDAQSYSLSYVRN